ncbi:MAG: PAS domain-containing sensor histidine kinase [Candidatus Binatia bacterium]
MPSAPTDTVAELHAELNQIVVRRLRLGLDIIAAALFVSILADHALMPARPLWADLMDGSGILMVLIGLRVLGWPSVRRHAVPFALFVVTLAYGMRLIAGIRFGEVTLTSMFCVVVAMTAGATLPWGFWPQVVTVLVAATTVLVNVEVVGIGAGDPAPHLAVAVLIPLLISVVLAIDQRRHRISLLQENRQRRRAESDLEQLNLELEGRVDERTAALVAATQHLEREALERQQAAHELHASRKQLQDILDNAPAAIHVKDVAGRYQLVNRHWEQCFAVRREAAVGKTLHDVFPPEIADALRANDQRVLAAGAPLQVEEMLRQPDGMHTVVSVKFPLLEDDGTIVGVCGISTDITERKQMEAELQRSEAALSALVENTSDAIWSVDRSGTIRIMNSVYRQRFRVRFGVDYDPVISQQRVPKAARDDLFALYRRAFAGERVQVERTIPLNGEPQHFLLSVHPIVENGLVTGATVFSKDITQRKRVEATARQHQADLAHVLRLGTMGEMAAGLAHEINQPLGAIANFAQGCVRRLRAGRLDGTALLPVVEQIAAEALRAGEIIRRLRELVRKESPEQHAIDINALVRKSIQVIEPEARQHDLRLELRLAPDLPPVICTAIQIEQVLVNLLLNGIDAMQSARNGDRVMEITTSAGGDSIEVAIRDGGDGIPEPPDDVFAPFFSTKPNGLGMGLSISRSIIEAHGGRLSAARNPDLGSTFRFTLPVRPDDATQSSAFVAAQHRVPPLS